MQPAESFLDLKAVISAVFTPSAFTLNVQAVEAHQTAVEQEVARRRDELARVPRLVTKNSRGHDGGWEEVSTINQTFLEPRIHIAVVKRIKT